MTKNNQSDIDSSQLNRLADDLSRFTNRSRTFAQLVAQLEREPHNGQLQGKILVELQKNKHLASRLLQTAAGIQQLIEIQNRL